MLHPKPPEFVLDMEKGLAAADYIILAGFFIVMLWIGVAYAGRMKNLSVYFSGSGQVPWWLSGISLYMTTFSAFTFVMYSAIAYKYGFVAVTILWLSVPAGLLSTWFLAARWRRAAATSPVEYLETRYSPAVRQTFSWFGIPLIVLDDALKLFVIGTMITASVGLTGTAYQTQSIIACGAIMLAYTFLGGLWAVLITDFVQFIVMAAAVLVLAPLASSKAGGVKVVLDNIPESHWSLSAGPYTWAWLLAFFLILLLNFATKWPYVQRYYAAGNDKDARKVGYTVAALNVIGPPIFFWPAFSAVTLLPGVEDANTIYPLLCGLLLPVGMMGLIIAAMFSATMSMLAGDYNALSAVITNDIVKRLFLPEATDRKLMVIARISTLIIGFIAMAIAVALVYQENLKEMVDFMAKLFAVLLPPVAMPMAAGLLSNRVSARGAVTGFALGSLCGVVTFLLGGGETLAFLRTVPWLTWMSIVPTALGLGAGSFLWPDGTTKREEVNAFLHGLKGGRTAPQSRDSKLDGLYAMNIIGLTTAMLGAVVVIAILVTGALGPGNISIGVGLALAGGGGGASWFAKFRMKQIGAGE